MSVHTTATNDQAFVLAAAREEQRVDGRKLLDHRRVQFRFHPQPGMVEVLLGGTRVLGIVTAETTAPHADRPSEGLFALDLTPLPLADPTIAVFRTAFEVKDVRAILQRALVRSKAVDLESLCIKSGLVVWHLRLDLKILDNGGNITDCAAQAGVLALKHFRLPEVEVKDEKITIYPATERVPRPLSLHPMPLCVTYGLLSLPEAGSEKATVALIADPTRLEETVMNGRIVVTAGRLEHSVVYAIHKYGGASVPAAVVTRCCAMAVERAAELQNVIESAVQDHEESRRLALMRGREQTQVQTADEAKTADHHRAGDVDGGQESGSSVEEEEEEGEKEELDEGGGGGEGEAVRKTSQTGKRMLPAAAAGSKAKVPKTKP